ncbi:phosphate/phosphite/phosphonate ABC transporter substrate-binding protein, partial [Parasutterella sp.]|uniref:phosphate/phosphite/phosphonate ABC transporter substrate-binding protein n=1 Tax=Parasutterella sp. TaxID=2049037 RepID=UPI003AEF48C3
AQQIATESRNHAYSPKEAVSSVFIVRNDRKDLQKISDLKGKVLSATEPHDFDGMLVGMGEIATRGFDPDTFFSKTLFSHYQYPDVATYVKVGAADVGILGTCQYEKLLKTGQIQPGEFRVLEARSNSEACLRSTERYPDTVFYALDTAPIEEVKAVSLSLLSMPKGEFNFEWVPASGFLKVYDLMKCLKLGPYEHLRETTVKDFILSHQKEFLLAALLLCAILVHIVRVNWLVNRRTVLS